MPRNSSPTKTRRRPGEVRDAIVSALQEVGKPMPIEDIRAAVALQLGPDVPASSIRSYLNLNEGPGKPFKRVGRGVYALRG